MKGTRIILAGSFIDGSGSTVRRNVFLALKDTIITAIGSTDALPLTDQPDIYDFSHCTIMPALVDCSVSLTRSPSVKSENLFSEADTLFLHKAAMLKRHIHYCHIHGVLGVANNSDNDFLVNQYREEMAQRSNMNLRTSGWLSRNRQDVSTGISKAGDFLRIEYSGNIEDENSSAPQLPYEDLRRILRHRNGTMTVVVANGPQCVEEALVAGCDAIEQGYSMGEDNLRKMAEKGVLWIPSVLRAGNALDSSSSGGDVCCRFSTRYVAPGRPTPGAKAFWQKMLTKQLNQLRLAGKLGVTVGVGTGSGSVGILHGESMIEEMKFYIKAGYSLEETIRCASENGAGFFGMKNLGTLAVGRKATFLITRGTPQQLPRKIGYLEGIYVDGAPSSLYQKNPDGRNHKNLL